MSENRDKERNREKTLKRSRMWQVVEEDDQEVEESESQSSSCDESSSDSESEGSERKRKHHKKHKKSEKKSKKSKKDKKERKKHNKKKKDKKDKHRNKTEKTAIDQNAYGKYGIIREEHYFQKQREFEAYIFEIKKIPGLFGQSKSEIMNYFRDYMEDYNTATLPHEKYYDYARWEMKEYEMSKKKKRTSAEEITMFNDEAAVAQERRAARQQTEQYEFNQTLSKMAADKDRRQDMRRQNQLQGELQQAYRRGDMTTVRRLEKILAPDEEKGGGIKHPWA